MINYEITRSLHIQIGNTIIARVMGLVGNMEESGFFAIAYVEYIS
jgi:hypothetical protein